MIIGVDEVGRGSWAGPVCVAAVAWPTAAPIGGLADSKQLTAVKRRDMIAHIHANAASIGIGWVSAKQIDEIGIVMALRQAAVIAVQQIDVQGVPIIVDGRDAMLGDIPAEYIIKADGTIPAVMAASIIAKVARDTYMAQLARVFTQYGFAKHVGYGTAAHQAAINEFGVCEHHRLSYGPLKRFAK